MKRFSFSYLFFIVITALSICDTAAGQCVRTLSDFQKMAAKNSPLLADYGHRIELTDAELERLKAVYTHSRLEMAGDYLFVPVVSSDGGRVDFKCNAKDGRDYFGYDLGERSGHLQAGLTWTKPLLGAAAVNVAREQADVNRRVSLNAMRLERHRLERAVTEQYLLCRLDDIELALADSVAGLLERQIAVARRLSRSALMYQTDVRLLEAEQVANMEHRATCWQSRRAHLADLNLLCGIADTTDVCLVDENLTLQLRSVEASSGFVMQYRLDSLAVLTDVKAFNLQYRPQLNVFVDGGLVTGNFQRLAQRLGWSTGLTLRWTLIDGHQRRLMAHEATIRQNTIRTYRQNAELQRRLQLNRCLAELKSYDERSEMLNRQVTTYANVLAAYEREIRAGQRSVVDYLTVLRSKVQAQADCLLLQTNRRLVVAAYNYWNW